MTDPNGHRARVCKLNGVRYQVEQHLDHPRLVGHRMTLRPGRQMGQIGKTLFFGCHPKSIQHVPKVT